MGYSTDFIGSLSITPPMKEEHINYINQFASTRRMKRNPEVAASLPDPAREAVGLGVGEEGEFFVGGIGFCGQESDSSVTNPNLPPATQPGLWCQWVVSNGEDGESYLEWDGSEKFYNYIEWMVYMIDNFFKPWGYSLNGEIEWQGEDVDDFGIIYCKENEVEAIAGSRVVPRPSWEK